MKGSTPKAIITEVVQISRGIVAPSAGDALNALLQDIKAVGGTWSGKAEVAPAKREHRDLFLEGVMTQRPYIPGFGELTPEALESHGETLELFHVTVHYSRGIEWGGEEASADDAGLHQQQGVPVAGDGQGEGSGNPQPAGPDAPGEGSAG
jgi:hypothetical protein